ncbi:MAG: methyltransferase domain-containing protein [Candidatus Omnitrophota bacterium]|nr:methyltransferase domain-containing protein [Candidatus Omnitrophota bacterium]
MKNVVINETGKASEFKPDVIFEKYLKLAEKDVRDEFSQKRNLALSNCPACRSKKKRIVFSHFGFEYAECLACDSVYMNPRPLDAKIKKHYLESASASFWRNTLSKKTEGKRKEKIYEKRFQWFSDIAQNHLPCATTIADFNSKDPEYTKEFLQNGYFKRKIVINPYFNILALDKFNVDASSYPVIEELADSLEDRGMVDVACAFEAIDCFADVELLLKTINALLCKGGLCFVTTISISGFDLQVLWGNSTSIFPPDRINVFSRKGLELLFKRHGFDIIEYSTPGFLDLDIVKNALKKDSSIELPRFVRTILKNGDDQVYQDFQEFLQLSKLSSFVRIVLKKK